MQHFSETWEDQQDKRKPPCCMCISLFVPIVYIMHDSDDTDVGDTDGVDFEELGEKLTPEEMEERLEQTGSCCGEEPEEHHAACQYYGQGIDPMIESMREARDME